MNSGELFLGMLKILIDWVFVVVLFVCFSYFVNLMVEGIFLFFYKGVYIVGFLLLFI